MPIDSKSDGEGGIKDGIVDDDDDARPLPPLFVEKDDDPNGDGGPTRDVADAAVRVI